MGEFIRKRVTTLPLVLISLSAAVPLAFNLLYISGVSGASFDLTPPVFSLSSLLMLLAVFRYDFLDINAMAFGQIFASISEGVIIYNRRGRITYCNQAAARWLKTAEGDFFETLEQQVGQPELSLEDGTRLRVRRYLHRDRRGNVSAGTVILTDVSEYYELLYQRSELEQSRMNLAVEQERNRIAQEVHDTTGHTLTMIQSLLRLLRAELGTEGVSGQKPEAERWKAAGEQPDSLIRQYLDQAQELTAGGIRELRCAINQMRRGGSPLTVTQGIRQLAEQVQEMEIEIDIQGEDGEPYTPLAPVVYSCLREAITNALKYAHATHMDVIVKFAADRLSLYIFDNGRGCAVIQENNGLRGIRDRARQAGGSVRVMSAEGEGFQIVLELPLQFTI